MSSVRLATILCGIVLLLLSTPLAAQQPNKPTNAGGPQITDLSLENVGPVLFSADGKVVYIVHVEPTLKPSSNSIGKQCTISIFGTDNLKRRTRVNIGMDVTSLALSSEGVVAVVRERRGKSQVWLLNPVTLAQKMKLDVDTADYVLASQQLNVAYAIHFQTHIQHVHVIDLVKKQLVKSLSPEMIAGLAQAKRPPDLKLGKSGASELVMATSGTVMIGESIGSLMRLSIRDGELAYEEIGPRISSTLGNVIVSSDGKYVAKSGPRFEDKQYAAVIYDVNDFAKPVSVILNAKLLAFGPPGSGVVYGQPFHEAQLMAYDMKSGAAIKRYDVDGVPLIHPEGGSFLVVDRTKAKWVVDPAGIGRRDGTGPQKAIFGRPLARNLPLGQPRGKVKDALVLQLKLDQAKVLPHMLWSADNQSAVILDHEGTLRRVSLPTLTELLRADLGVECSHITACSAGLVVTVESRQEVWVLDESTFELKHQIPVASVQYVATNRNMTVGLAYAARGRSTEGANIKMIDLASGEVLNPADSPLKAWREDKVGKKLVTMLVAEVRDIEAVPDGNSFNVITGPRSYIFDMKGADLVLRGAETIEHPVRSFFDPMGVYVSKPVMEVRRETPAAGKGAYIYRTEIFRAKDFTSTAMVVDSDYHNPLVQLDPFAQQVYALGDGGFLTVYNARGSVTQSYQVDESSKATSSGQKNAIARQLLVHPGGQRMLVLTSEKLLLVSLPGAPPELTANLERKDWLGEAASAGKDDALAKLSVIIERTSLGTKREVLHGGAVTPLRITARDLVPSLPFSTDGKYFYMLEAKTGLLHQVSPLGLFNEREVNLGRECIGLALSASGVVVATKQPQELWVFDTETLKPKLLIPVPGMVEFTAAPGASVAFARYSDPDKLAVIDLSNGEIHETLSAAKMNQELNPPGEAMRRFVTFEKPQLTPDGKLLLCARVVFDVEGMKLKWKSDSGITPDEFDLPFSSDSQFTAGPSAHSGRQPQPGVPLLGQGMTIFSLKTLKQPLSCVGSGTALAFDDQRGLIYVGENNSGLSAYETTGKLIPTSCYRAGNYDKPDHPARHIVDVVLMHADPASGHLLVLTKDNLLWVEPPGLATRRKPIFEDPIIVAPDKAKQFEGRAPAYYVASNNGRETFELSNLTLTARDIASGKPLRANVLRELNPADLQLTKNFIVIQSSGGALFNRGDLAPAGNVKFHGGVGHIIAATEENDRIVIVNWDGFTIGDCTTGKAVNSVLWDEVKRTPLMSRPLPGTDGPFRMDAPRMPVLTPDGSYLFVVSAGRICRLQVTGDDLLLDAVGPANCDRNQPHLAMSRDGKYLVAWPVAIEAVARVPNQYQPGVAVYDVNKLDKPLFVHAAEPTFAQFDANSLSLFVPGDFGTLAKIDLATQKVRQFKLPCFIDIVTSLRVLSPNRIVIRRRAGTHGIEQWQVDVPD